MKLPSTMQFMFASKTREKRGLPLREVGVIEMRPTGRDEVEMIPNLESSRSECPICGSSWPMLALEMECSCPAWPPMEEEIVE